jgi:tetratricopeptide (TPR) repeat protein
MKPLLLMERGNKWLASQNWNRWNTLTQSDKLHWLAALSTIAISALALPSLAFAGDKVIIGPAPDWVLPAEFPAADGPAQAASVVPLFDEQTLIDGDLSVSYSDIAITLSNQQLLNQFGTLSFTWQPEHGDLTVHSIELIRGKERIDQLKDGPGFTVLRREAKLEQLSLDGVLTAIMPVRGLRIGDVLRIVQSTTSRDKTLNGRVQAAMTLVPAPTVIRFGRARLVWPEQQQIAWKVLMPGVTAQPRSIAGGRKELVINLPVVKLPELPGNIPRRFSPIPAIEVTNFTGWQDVATQMAPLFQAKGLIADGSDLANVVDGIMKANADPVARMAAALRIVQEDVRYQLIALGVGNYVPQKPAETWSGRYGDCKAKTLLLMAMLDRMGINSEAVLASSVLGDVAPLRLPSAQAFDHVFVHAVIAEESFWLDGTSLGARLGDIRNVPRLGHVLPLRMADAALIALPTRADARAARDAEIVYDSTAGLHLPVPFTMKLQFTGVRAQQFRSVGIGDGGKGLMELAEQQANQLLGTTTITTPKVSYDEARASWTIDVAGLAYPDWKFTEGRWQFIPKPLSKLTFEADRSKSAWREIPALFENPWTSRVTWNIQLPERARGAVIEGSRLDKISFPGVSYQRTIELSDLKITSTEDIKESGAEVAPAEIGAVRRAIAALDEKTARIAAQPSYPQRWDDIALGRKAPAFKKIQAVFDSRIAEKPDEAQRYADRAWFATRTLDWAAAEADYTKAVELDPTLERYLQRADVRSSRGNLAGALADSQAAYALDSENQNVRGWLSISLLALGKVDEALDLIEADVDPASEGGEGKIVARAEALVQGGRADEGFALLDDGLKKRPNSATMLNGRCWLHGLKNIALDAALADCTRAIELEADPAGYFDSRAMVHFQAGRFAAATADLNSALAILPELAASLFMKGVIANREGDRAAAEKQFSAARKLRPSIDLFFSRYGIKP